MCAEGLDWFSAALSSCLHTKGCTDLTVLNAPRQGRKRSTFDVLKT